MDRPARERLHFIVTDRLPHALDPVITAVPDLQVVRHISLLDDIREGVFRVGDVDRNLSAIVKDLVHVDVSRMAELGQDILER